MTFQFNKRKVLGLWSIIGLLILLNLVDLGFKIYRTTGLGIPFESSSNLQFGYIGLAIWWVWHVPTVTGHRIEVSESEIKLVNRAGRVVKSRRFDEISELKLGTFEIPPRNHWMIFADGKKWLVSRYCDNFDVLVRLIEERAGMSFLEPISSTKKQ